MTVDIIAHDTPAALIALIEHLNTEETAWGVVIVKRKYLRPTTNEAFQLLIKGALHGAAEAHTFFIGGDSIYIAWRGKQKVVYMHLRSLISTTLVQPGLTVDPAAIMVYRDPRTCGEELKALCKSIKAEENIPDDDNIFSGIDENDESIDVTALNEARTMLKATSEQVDIYTEIRNQKPYRKQLNFLVVEDQIFSQKLLCDILRGVRVNNNNESPYIDAAQGVQDAWKAFLKKAPDITFVDLRLVDGSGHELARAIKEIDPQARIIIVTANNYEEEFAVARQNNVDSFIAKPYNKKQILDCVGNYVGSVKQKNGAASGKFG